MKTKWFVNGDLQWLILFRVVLKSSTKKDDDQDDEDESRDLFSVVFLLASGYVLVVVT